MAGVGGHRDAWGKGTPGCEATRELGRTTWVLCGKPQIAVGVYGDGNERRLCSGHVKGALRKRTFYADEVVELRTPDGAVTHRLVRTRGRKGRMERVMTP